MKKRQTIWNAIEPFCVPFAATWCLTFYIVDFTHLQYPVNKWNKTQLKTIKWWYSLSFKLERDDVLEKKKSLKHFKLGHFIFSQKFSDGSSNVYPLLKEYRENCMELKQRVSFFFWIRLFLFNGYKCCENTEEGKRYEHTESDIWWPNAFHIQSYARKKSSHKTNTFWKLIWTYLHEYKFLYATI